MQGSKMRWKITEQKYLKLRRNTLIVCALAIVIYTLLLRYAMNVNLSAFMYDYTSQPSAFQRIESMLWWIIGIGWVAVSILFCRELKHNPKHWFWKLKKKYEELQDED